MARRRSVECPGVRQGPGDLGRPASGAMRAKPGRPSGESHCPRPSASALETTGHRRRAAARAVQFQQFADAPAGRSPDCGRRTPAPATGGRFQGSAQYQLGVLKHHQRPATCCPPVSGRSVFRSAGQSRPTTGNRRRPGHGQRSRYRICRALPRRRGAGAGTARRRRLARHSG
ncbi:hypothetical protein D3C72_1145750 [compost metagenome]